MSILLMELQEANPESQWSEGFWVLVTQASSRFGLVRDTEVVVNAQCRTASRNNPAIPRAN